MKTVNNGQRILALLLCFFLCVSLINYKGIAFAGDEETVRVQVGVSGVHVELSSPDLPGSYEAVTDEKGEATFDELYLYLAKNLHWDGSVPEPEPSEEGEENVPPAEDYVPEKTQITVHYDVNYADVKTIGKNDMTSGNARYEGTRGSFVLCMEEPPASEEENETTSYLYTSKILLEKPEPVSFVSGQVKIFENNQLPQQAVPFADVQVMSEDDNGNLCGVTTTKAGEFEFYPQIRLDHVNARTIQIPETPYYYGYEKTLEEFLSEDKGVIILRKKFKATAGKDYTYGKDIQFGYVAAPGEYKIFAGENKEISLAAEGPFSDYVKITVDEFGTASTVFVKNEDGEISQPVINVLTLDQDGPVISSVDSVKETEGGEINFNAFGIFTNIDADLTLQITVDDEGCGVEKLYLTGTNKDGSTVKYNALNSEKGDGIITSTFLVPAEETILEQELAVTAVDYLGNESQFKIIRETQEKSTITIEKNSPEVTDIKINGAASQYGWYRDSVGFSFSAMDRESGLKQVIASINGHGMISDVFADHRENDAKDYSFTLSKELISQLETSDGTYKVDVAVKDNAGNVSIKQVVIRADIVAPVVSLSGVNAGSYYKTPPTVTIHNTEKYAAAAGSAIYANIYRNGALIYNRTFASAASAALSSEFNGDGQYRVSVYAVDAAGNMSQTLETNFTVDGTAPVITAGGVVDVTPSKFGWFNQPLSYRLSTEDATSGIADNTVTVNGKKVPYDGNMINLTKELLEDVINEDGTYTIEVLATDRAGNSSSYKDVLKIDLNAPVLSLSGIEKGKHYNRTPVLTVKNDEKHYDEDGAFIKVTVERDGKVVSQNVYPKENQVEMRRFKTDGDYKITVEAMDAALNMAEKKTTRFVKDSTAPVITISGAKEGEYYNTSKTISVKVNERYFKTNNVKVDVTKNLDGASSKINFTWENNGKESINRKTFSATGTYKIRVSAVDEAGNVARLKSLQFTVDTIAPQVEIRGVTNNKIYTYDDVVAPVISYSDSYYDGKDVSIMKANIPWYGNLSKGDSGSQIKFSDFKKIKENDGIYHLRVTIRDKAGNSTTKEVDFAVNRFGSLFTYSDQLSNLNGKYVKNVTEDLVINERNISILDGSTNEIKRDGQIIDGNVATSLEGKRAGYNVYQHRFSTSNFKEEGVYQLNVISKDKAGNEMESQEDAGQVKFFVDRTAPVLNVEGMIETYVNADTLTITAGASDNLAPVELFAEVNGVKQKLSAGDDGKVSFTVSEGIAQEICITAVDAAGNTETYKKEITVTSNTALYFLMRYKVILAVAAAVIVLGAALLIFRRKKKDNAEK